MTVLDRVPLEDINTRARDVAFGRTLLTIIAAILYATGWAIGKSFSLLWLALAWSATAIQLGWQEARKPASATPGP